MNVFLKSNENLLETDSKSEDLQLGSNWIRSSQNGFNWSPSQNEPKRNQVLSWAHFPALNLINIDSQLTKMTKLVTQYIKVNIQITIRSYIVTVNEAGFNLTKLFAKT